jgi:hypothetical protein
MGRQQLWHRDVNVLDILASLCDEKLNATNLFLPTFAFSRWVHRNFGRTRLRHHQPGREPFFPLAFLQPYIQTLFLFTSLLATLNHSNSANRAPVTPRTWRSRLVVKPGSGTDVSHQERANGQQHSRLQKTTAEKLAPLCMVQY